MRGGGAQGNAPVIPGSKVESEDLQSKLANKTNHSGNSGFDRETVPQ